VKPAINSFRRVGRKWSMWTRDLCKQVW